MNPIIKPTPDADSKTAIEQLTRGHNLGEWDTDTLILTAEAIREELMRRGEEFGG